MIRYLLIACLFLTGVGTARAWEKTRFFMEGETARLEARYSGYPITVALTAFGRNTDPASVQQAFEEKLRERVKRNEAVYFGMVKGRLPFGSQVRYATKEKDHMEIHIVTIVGDTGGVISFQFNVTVADPMKADWDEFTKFIYKEYNPLTLMLQNEASQYQYKQLNPITLFGGNTPQAPRARNNNP